MDDNCEDMETQDNDDSFTAQDLFHALTTAQDESEQINDLQSFCKKAFQTKKRRDYDIVEEFLKIPNSCFKLVNVLDSGSISKELTMNVFKTLRAILLRITDDLSQFEKLGHDVIYQLLQFGVASFGTLLAEHKHRGCVKAALQLLTLIVMMGSQSAKALSSQFALISDHLQPLASMRKYEDPSDIRTCLVHFVMSFLIVDIHSVIRQICEQKAVLSAIIIGLPYDKSSLIQPFLMTLKSKVLENASVSKTLKIRILNERTLSSVFDLLSWKGPKTLVDKKLLRKTKRAEDAWILQDASKEEVETVHKTAFEFLQVACASHKHGIIFHTNQAQQGRNPNYAITKVLVSQPQPFEDERKRELVAQILCACPDQTLYFLSQVKASFEPRNSLPWFQAMTCIIRVAALQNLEPHFSQSAPQKDISPIAKRIQTALGMFVVTKKIIFTALKSSDILLKATMVDWLIVTFKQIRSIPLLHQKYLEWNVPAIYNEIIQFLPTLPSMFPIFLEDEDLDTKINKATFPDGMNLSLADYLHKIIDVLVLAGDTRSATLETEVPDAFSKLISLVQKHQASLDGDSVSILHLKILKLVFSDRSSSSYLNKEMEITRSPLYMLFDLYTRANEKSVLDCVKQLVSKVFQSLDSFKEHDMEIDIWLHELGNLPTKKKKKLALVTFCQAVQSLLSKTTSQDTGSLENGTDEPMVKRKKTEIEFLTPQQKDISISEKADRPKGPFYSPLVPAVLSLVSQNNDVKGLKGYLESVLVRILHQQDDPEPLCIFLHAHRNEISKFLQYYVGLWHPELRGSEQQSQTFQSFWTKHQEKVQNGKGKNLVGLHLTSAFVLLHLKQDWTDKNFLGQVSSVVSKIIPKSRSEAGELLFQSMLYLNTRLQAVLNGELQPDSVFVLCSLVDKLLEYMFSFISDDSEKLNTVWRTLNHPLFKFWFLSPSDRSSCNKVIEECCALLTDLTTKYLKMVAELECEPQRKTDLFHPYKHKLLTVLEIVCSEPSTERLWIWRNLYQGVAGCLKMLSLSELAHLLNGILAVPAPELVAIPDVFSLVHTLLNSFVEFDAKSEIFWLKLRTVKSMFDLVGLGSADTREGVNLLGGLVRFMEQNPVFCVAVDSECFNHLLSEGSTGSLSVIKVLCSYNLGHCSSLHKWLIANLNSLESWPPVLCLRILVLAIQSYYLKSDADSQVLNELSRIFWQRLSVVIYSREILDHSSEDGLNLISVLCRLLQENRIDSSSLDVMTSRVVKKLHSSQQEPSLNRLCLLTQVFQCIQTSCPSYKIKGLSPTSALIKIHLHCLGILLGNPESSALVLLDLATETLNITQAAEKSEVVDALLDFKEWFSFVTNLLRRGLKCSITGPSVLCLLKELCHGLYGNSESAVSPSSTELLGLVLGHSAVTSILVEEENSLLVLKEPIVDLWISLVELNSSGCQSDHFPVLLGSYRATLKSCDLKLLYLMNLYEINGISMHGFRPFLWGSTALAYYSSQASSRLSLWKQPKLEDIVHLLDKEKLLTASLNFPLNLPLTLTKDFQLANTTALNAEDFHSLYDPRFLLMVLNHLVQPGSVVNCEKFISCHCLALVLSSLSSHDSGLRSLGYQVLGLFYQHLEGRRNHQNKIWLFFLDALRNALQSPNVRLSSLITCFLAKASVVLTKPNDHLFNVISKFLSLKPALDVRNVPEFYTLFYSSDIHHIHHRTWLLSCLHEGLRDSLDFHLFQKRYIFAILLSYCTSAVCSVANKISILGILRSALRIRSAALTLCRAQNLLTWIQSLITNHVPEKHKNQILSEVVLCLETLWEISKTRREHKPRRNERTKEESVTKKEAEDSESESEEDAAAGGTVKEHLEIPQQPMDVAPDAAEPKTSESSELQTPATFYSLFPSQFLLVCVRLMETVKDHPDVKIVSQCLKICHECFASCPFSESFLPFLTEEHLELLLACARSSSRFKAQPFSTRTAMVSATACSRYATQILFLVPPQVYLNSETASSVFEAATSVLVSQDVDHEFVNLACGWMMSCLQSTLHRNSFLSLFEDGSNGSASRFVGLLLRWMSVCVAECSTSPARDSEAALVCLRSLVRLFGDLLKGRCQHETTSKPDEESTKKIVKVSASIQKAWLEGSTSKKVSSQHCTY